MKVLVTGADGFIGKNVCVEFKERGDEVFYGSRRMPKGIDESHYRYVDLLDQDSVRAVLIAVKPDVVVNCAGIVDASQNVNNNSVFTQNLIQAASTSDIKIKRIIICSSAGVYGVVEPNELPVVESTSLRAVSAYGLSKIAEESVAISLGKKYDIPITIVRIFNPIGKGMGPRFLVSNILNQVNELKRDERTELEVSRLDSSRDYVSVQDVARAITIISHGKPKQTVYNVGSGRSTTNARLIELILDGCGIKSRMSIKETADSPELPVASQADITRICDDLGWEPRVSIEDSVKGVIDEANQKSR